MAHEPKTPSGGAERIYDLNVALERMDGDVPLLEEVIDIFLDDYANSIAELRQAAASRDQAALQRAAHTLKGAVGNFVAHRATEAALSVETLAKAGQLDLAISLTPRLEDEVARLAAALKQYRHREAA
ncbi:MAG: Hpt domain-containing protein [Verrucomicrobia bacterium]|nr:Hpt domain-containing protein [Verrucomicrobiota bacterium]MBI3869192.1 Hpt domain-containing protein [Verrucomicrobiota bacterium]